MLFETWQACYGDQPTRHSYRVSDWFLNLQCVCRQTTVRDWSGFGFVSLFRIRPSLRFAEGYSDPCDDDFTPFTDLYEIDRWTWRERVITNDPFRPEGRYL